MSFLFNDGREVFESIRNAIINLVNKSFGGGGFTLIGGVTSETLTIAGISGTLGIDIDTGPGNIAYDEAFDTNIETTIDNWLTSHAANLLSNQGITATKATTTTILLIGSISSGIYTFTDGGATMTATSGGQSTTFTIAEGRFYKIHIIATATFDAAGTNAVRGDQLPIDYAAVVGDDIYGEFDSILLSAGEVLAYRM